MFRVIAAAAVAGFLMSLPGIGHAASPPNVGPSTKVFAFFPEGASLPEGITANPANGDIYVSSFAGGVADKLLRYTSGGTLVSSIDPGPAPVLGIFYEPGTDMIYMAVVGAFVGEASRIQRIAADLDPATLEDVADIPAIGAPDDLDVGNPDGSTDVITFGNNIPLPNDLVINGAGDLYVSDSFQGAIFRVNDAIGCVYPSCIVDTVAHDGRLATTGFPPFGANGVALNDDESVLFVANTGDDRILKLDLFPVPDDPDDPDYVDPLTPFAESVNGADGIAFDDDGLLWVAANQADRLVALNSAGKPVAELGGFGGIAEDGSPRGLLFPASLAILGDKIFVTNLALPLNGVTGDEWEEEVTRYTISRANITVTNP